MAKGLTDSQSDEVRAVARAALELLPSDPGEGDAAERVSRAARAAAKALAPS